MNQYKTLIAKPLINHAIRFSLYAILAFSFYLLAFASQAYAACFVNGGGALCTTYSLNADQIAALGAGGCPNAFNGVGLPPGDTWSICCDRRQDYCNTYAVRSAVCGNSPEIPPGCGVCGENVLKCWGNDYRRCPTDESGDPVTFPPPSEFGGNNSAYLGGDLDGIILYNDVTYTGSWTGVYFCDANTFGCNDGSCTGGQSEAFLGGECPASFGFIGGTYFNACVIGPLCDLDEQYYSPGDFIIGDILTFPVGEFPKRAPHPQYDTFKNYICDLGECVTEYTPTDINNPQDPAMFCDIGAIRSCTDDELINCSLSSCTGATGYCEEGASRNCSDGLPYICTENGWEPTGPLIAGNCYPTKDIFVPEKKCVGTPPSDPSVFNKGSWEFVSWTGTTTSDDCENMYAEMPVAFTPGYVLTMIPHLQSIWENTVNRKNAIFTPFRTAKTFGLNDEDELAVEFNPVEEWPGESYFKYSFDGGWAMAGDPNEIDPPDRAAVYFRYLGYILCSRENLIDKLSPFTANPSYQYYEPRCDNNIW